MTVSAVRPEPRSPWHPVMFDMDGTLIDSAPAILRRLRETLEHYEVEPPADAALIHYIGPPIRTTLTDFVNADHVDEAVAFYRSLSARDGLDRQRLFHGIPAFLATLANVDVPLAVASSKPQHEIEHILRFFDIADYFTAAVGSSETRNNKAQVVDEALRRLGRTATSPALMVGDRVWDIEGAAAHNVPTVLVSWGYAAAGEESAAIAHVTTVNDLADFILNGSQP